MTLHLSPTKVILLVVDLVVQARLSPVYELASQHRESLRQDLLYRILLTYLPETTPASAYVDFVQKISRNELSDHSQVVFDTTVVDSLTEEQAQKRVRKLHLLPLRLPEDPNDHVTDTLVTFIIHRAYRLDEEAAMLDQVPALVWPFMHHSIDLRMWMASTVVPFLRRNHEYYVEESRCHTLRQFQQLEDGAAVQYLLSRTGQEGSSLHDVGRDLRGLLSPWLHHVSRWPRDTSATAPLSPLSHTGWQRVLDWLIAQASSSWQVAVRAFEGWDGPCDTDFGGTVSEHDPACRLREFDRSYANAALAAAYLVPESTVASLEGVCKIINRARSVLGMDMLAPLRTAKDSLPTISRGVFTYQDDRVAGYLRNDLLQESNPLTEPTAGAVDFGYALTLSAYIFTSRGIPCSVRRAGTLTLLRDKREQQNELTKLIHHVSNQAPNGDDGYWLRARQDILWLHDWGLVNNAPMNDIRGVFGMISRDDIETELLRSMLSNTRYTLVKSIYEDTAPRPLEEDIVQEAVHHAALDAFDNASNPNRTRGGLKKSNDIIQALPTTVPPTLPMRKEVEALISAAHALSTYKLVLKQGEPFAPVMLRVHADPIGIIEKVLAQNKGAYTRFPEFLEMGMNLLTAGFLARGRIRPSQAEGGKIGVEASKAEKRILSFCISAALQEDDFETAYSYVVSRLGQISTANTNDPWSWRAALQAGQYVRTPKSQMPTHLGISSGNLEIRHLEQRLECLATALRVAPVNSLQGVLENFLECESHLERAVADEAAKEEAFDVGVVKGIPGSFIVADQAQAYVPRNGTASATSRQGEEAPMSLFDLSKATAHIAQRNFTALSSLRGLTRSDADDTNSSIADSQTGDARVRKRDQLREAATGTLVSGVGWLIGANVKPS